MEIQTKTPVWQDWALIALRSFLLIVAFIEFPTLRATDGNPYVQSEVTVALVIGVMSTILLIIPIIFPKLHFILPPILVVSDWLLMALIIYISRGDTLVCVATGSLLIVTSVMRLRVGWGVIQSMGIVIVMFLIRPEVAKLVPAQAAALADRVPIFVIALFGVVANGWTYALQQQIKGQEAQLLAEKKNRERQIVDMQDRTKAIYDMAAVLSSTLNYEKILQAAMNVGWLGLRDKNREIPEKLVSMVLLFRSSDNQLHVVVSRGLTRLDEQRATPGLDGFIGEALKETIPVFGDNPRKDAELGNFVAFQTMRSVMCIPLRAGFDNYGITVYGSPFPDAFTGEHTELLTAIGSQATIALQNAHLYQNLLDERDKLIDAEEEARKKLARDLHDGPTQDVAAIAMRMSIIQKLLERNPDEVPNELRKIEDLARKTTKEIRHMLFTLRPLVLENQGLTAALGQLADKMKEAYEQPVTVRVANSAERALDSHQQGVIFYIIEEAVGNARKHAKASMITVNVYKQEDVVLVNISDNGVGFDTTEAEKKAMERGGHLGMINLRERAEMVGGTLRMESAAGKGTSITVVVPIKSAESSNTSLKAQSSAMRQATGKTTKLEAVALERIRRQSGN
ncbi:MAG: GAF domain-containing sensor histidine kinase [Chloroflexi bacterium]|nr:GAF domain-containing sensor histidine kinase [Chloroflexota bacterium]MCC6893778.1 GAF domain-containing sensor histidine kinase [Anaerolineae bacterium]